MIKRHSSNVQDGVLPFAAMDDNTGGSTGGLQRISVHGGRRLAGKPLVWLRILGGTLFLAVASLYIVGVRHVTLHNASVPFSPGRGLFHDLVHKNDANANGNANAHRDQGAGTARNLHRPIVVANARSAGQKPRVLGHYYARADAGSYVGTEALSHPLYDNRRARIPRGVFMTKTDIRRQRDLLDSDDYENGAADVMEDMGENCTAQYDWQEGFFPTCNHLMEIDMTNLSPLPMFHEDHYNNKHDLPVASSSLHSYSKMISHGYWRDVWTVENLLRNEGNPEEVVVLKTMRYTHDYKPRNYDRHRRDAVTMERLTSSTFIVDIYAACGNSGLFEHADGGSLDDSVWYNYHHEDGDKEKPWTPQEKVIIGYQAASGLADLHNFAKEGVPAVAHTDIGSTQFVYVDKAGVYKLNDFNRARFLAKNNFTNEICTYEVGNNPGTWRSPEEYHYDPQTEKVDVYSFGNVLYSVLTGKYPFQDKEEKEARKLIKKGNRPIISSSVRNSTDPFDQAMITAIEMCWIQDPSERASARQVQQFFLSELRRLGVRENR